MSDTPDDLLTLLGKSPTEPEVKATPTETTQVQLLTSILTAAQNAGLTPNQTAEMIRGLGMSEVIRAAQTPPPAPIVPPNQTPPPVAKTPPAVSTPAAQTPPISEPPVAKTQPISDPPAAKPPSVERPRPARVVPPRRAIRAVQSPAALRPRPLKATSHVPERPKPPRVSPPGSLPPLPRTPPRSDEPVQVAREPTGAAASKLVKPRRALTRKATPKASPRRAQADLDTAARALAESMENLEEVLRPSTPPAAKPPPGRRREPVARPGKGRFGAQSSPSNRSSMLDVLIHRSPPYTGEWIWRDANIRSPLRMSLARLLLHFTRTDASVRIELTCERARAVIIIAEGRLVSARTNLATAQLGEVLVARTRIAPADQADARLLRTPRSAATWATRTGHLTSAELHDVVVATIRSNLALCLQWPGGTFRVFEHQLQRDGGPRLQTLNTLLQVVDAIPVQRALSHLEQFAPNALLSGPHAADAEMLAWDDLCASLTSLRPQPEPLSEQLGRLSAPTLDAARRVVLLIEAGVLKHGPPVASVGVQEIHRKRAPKPAVGFDCSPLAEQFGVSLDTARVLTEVTLRACLVHVPCTQDADLDELLRLARMAVSRDARPAGTTAADRAMLQAFTDASLTVPDMCDFCARLVTGMAVLGINLQHFVPRKSVLGVVLYTDRPDGA